MAKVLACLCFALVIIGTLAANAFTATGTLTHASMKGGFVNISLSYSWTTGNLAFSYPSRGDYREVFSYNAEKGYGTEKPFKNQWASLFGADACECQNSPINSPMPELFMSARYKREMDVLINEKICTHFSKLSTNPSLVSDLYLTVSGDLCRFNFEDGREITIKEFTATEPPSSDFIAPDVCKCNKMLDIILVLDRSMSIHRDTFLDEKAFVADFTSQFEYGPLSVALGIVNFNTQAWTSLKLNEGISNTSVVSAVNDLQCCQAKTSVNDPVCCKGETSISSGIREGIWQLNAGRLGATKVLIVVTDGIQNTDQYGKRCPTPTDTNPYCRQDLLDAVDFAHRLLPEAIFYAVGVGADTAIAYEQLVNITRQHPERVLVRSDFKTLAEDNLELVASACESTLSVCSDCCGLCVCGQCQSPDGCTSSNFCDVASLESGNLCCRSTPRDCGAGSSDLCKIWSCNRTSEACENVEIPCKAGDECVQFHCNSTVGLCQAYENPFQANCSIVPECVENTDCDDMNACTEDTCVKDKCVWKTIPCGDPNNKCETAKCLPATGCVITKFPDNFCDDDNNCTIDTCSPTKGCVHEEYVCPRDGSFCTSDECHPVLGCFYAPKLCPAEKACRVGYCENITGRCLERKVSCGDPTTVYVVTGALGAAAIVGIVVGAVVVLCLAGGGAYYAKKISGPEREHNVGTNPLYRATSGQGENPFYKGT